MANRQLIPLTRATCSPYATHRSRTLLCVFQLHAAAINSLVVCGGVCVTGSDDRLVRMWPLDFSDYLVQVCARVCVCVCVGEAAVYQITHVM